MNFTSEKQDLPSIFILVLPSKAKVEQALQILQVVRPVASEKVMLLCLHLDPLRIVAHKRDLCRKDDHLELFPLEELFDRVPLVFTQDWIGAVLNSVPCHPVATHVDQKDAHRSIDVAVPLLEELIMSRHVCAVWVPENPLVLSVHLDATLEVGSWIGPLLLFNCRYKSNQRRRPTDLG